MVIKRNETFHAKVFDKISQNKLCVNKKGPYKICKMRNNPLILKAITIIDPITRWFEVPQ